MSYCRFQNTLSDLRDCYHNWDGDTGTYEDDEVEELSDDEKDAQTDLLALCRRIITDYDEFYEVTHVDDL